MTAAHTLRLLNWNVAWASPRSKRGKIIREIIHLLDPDVICITEGYTDFLPEFGHLITSEADYGYPIQEGRRKVLLWSKFSWHDASPERTSDMPPGRYVDGVTRTRLGDLRFVGVCIPWRHAHVSTGHRNRTVWEDHLRYLEGLTKCLPAIATHPLVMTGDFNQRIPPSYMPKRVSQALHNLLDAHELSVITSGPLPETHHATVDHIALSPELSSERVWALPAVTSDNFRLSDHEGIVADMHYRSSLASLSTDTQS